MAQIGEFEVKIRWGSDRRVWLQQLILLAIQRTGQADLTEDLCNEAFSGFCERHLFLQAHGLQRQECPNGWRFHQGTPVEDPLHPDDFLTIEDHPF